MKKILIFSALSILVLTIYSFTTVKKKSGYEVATVVSEDDERSYTIVAEDILPLCEEGANLEGAIVREATAEGGVTGKAYEVCPSSGVKCSFRVWIGETVYIINESKCAKCPDLKATTLVSEK